uniref:Uncharacterized protein n=1 Tax=Meloidogyne enterolobii TaxID=390850 RepID=A0A6V7VET3_MELEN|nr:unnamed protein product [Meloidogyne enterolobii]
MGQKQPSLLPNFGDDPPVPDQKNSILKPIPSKYVEEYFWNKNYFPDTIPFNNDSSSHASAESSSTQHYFSDVSSNLEDRYFVRGTTPPPTIENNFGKTLQQQQKQNINKNNLQSQSWDDIGLGNDLFGNDCGSDDSDFLVKNTQHCQQSMVGTSNSLLGNNNLNNNNNASKSINKFEGPIGFDCEVIEYFIT